ncbi:MAG: hypothetical protein PHR96_02755 [Clostridia bacterium]|nr:hypothetical protein [Clostridia bacterium]
MPVRPARLTPLDLPVRLVDLPVWLALPARPDSLRFARSLSPFD